MRELLTSSVESAFTFMGYFLHTTFFYGVENFQFVWQMQFAIFNWLRLDICRGVSSARSLIELYLTHRFVNTSLSLKMGDNFLFPWMIWMIYSVLNIICIAVSEKWVDIIKKVDGAENGRKDLIPFSKTGL